MKKKTIYIDDLHFEHKLWKSQLQFEQDELKIFMSRLEHVVQRWTDKDVLKKVEHFQNTFFIHQGTIDELIEVLDDLEHKLSERAKANPVAIDHVHFQDHDVLRDRVGNQLRIYSEMKGDFMKFLREAM